MYIYISADLGVTILVGGQYFSFIRWGSWCFFKSNCLRCTPSENFCSKMPYFSMSSNFWNIKGGYPDFGYTHVAASCHDSMARQAGTTAPIFFYIMCHSSSLYGINQCSADVASVPILHLSVIVVIIARSIVLEIEFLHHSMFIRLNNNSYWSYNGTSAWAANTMLACHQSCRWRHTSGAAETSRTLFVAGVASVLLRCIYHNLL